MSNSYLKILSAKIKNIFMPASFTKRSDDGTVQVQTAYGRVIDNITESFPYGFTSKATEGTVTVLCAGGSLDAIKILPVESSKNAPELSDGDVAIYSCGGAPVICRQDGTVELNGTDNSGLVKADELKAQLDKNNQILQTLKLILSTPIPEMGNGAPSAFQAALNAALSGLPLADFSHIKSDTVMHGNG